MRAAGVGRKTHQYNPVDGAKSVAQWVTAVMSMKGESDAMPVSEAVEIIRATPQRKRSEYAREIWSRRRKHNSAERHWMDRLPVLRRANPTTGVFEAFHGRKPDGHRSDVKRMKYPSKIELLGGLMELNLEDPDYPDLEFDPDTTMLYSNRAGNQYYVRGSGMAIDLDEFPDVDPDKDEVDLGHICSVVYWTDKQHLGEEDRKPGPFEHEFGEEGGKPPRLVYDVLNSEPKFVGGTYRIDWDMDGGRYSAGIRD